jgi:hypothetical protein
MKVVGIPFFTVRLRETAVPVAPDGARPSIHDAQPVCGLQRLGAPGVTAIALHAWKARLSGISDGKSRQTALVRAAGDA